MKPLFWAFAIFFVIVTVFPLIRSFRWWVCVSDFPRLQIAAALVFLLISYLLLFEIANVWDWVYVAAVAAALGLQLFRIFPLTMVAPKQVLKSSRK